MPSAYSRARDAARAVSDRLKLRDAIKVEGPKPRSRTLVIMLAGYKQPLWPLVIPRFAAALPDDCDVCLLSPGLHLPELAETCRSRGWIYVSTATNDVSLAQNVCLQAFPDAEMIVKLDEDMFLLPGSIGALIAFYRAVTAEGHVRPGFVAPMIPINGFAYRPLLERIGLIDAFEAQFGPAALATTGIPIAIDPAAARWMWRHTAPLAPTLEKLRAAPAAPLLSPIKFSIGMIAYERAFWEELRYFPVHRHRLLAGQSTLGADEEFFCKECVDRSRPIVINPHLLAGHFSFGPQYRGMLDLLAEEPALFAVEP